MECPAQNGEGGELIVGYAARTLDPKTEAAFEQHVQVCAKCREAVRAQQSVWTALDEWRPEPVSADFDQKLFRRIAEEEQSNWWRRFVPAAWSWREALPVAAACSVLIAASLLKIPVASGPAESSLQPKLQIEQVEHALDDMDLLNQVGVETAAEKPGSSERI
jgi:hypothetical protein